MSEKLLLRRSRLLGGALFSRSLIRPQTFHWHEWVPDGYPGFTMKHTGAATFSSRLRCSGGRLYIISQGRKDQGVRCLD